MLSEEAWRLIPPEEKLTILARAHACGVLWALSLVAVGATMAVSFQSPSIFWTAIIACPIVFQFSASRRWRTLRPKCLLEYLAARSVTRRYAYAIKSADLEISLLFRGFLTHEAEGTDSFELYSQHYGNELSNIPVWIALFPDSVVVISEQFGGANLEFGHVINARFKMTSESPDGREYSPNLKVLLEYDDRNYGKHLVSLTARYPAAINAFEKKLKEILATPRAQRVDFDTGPGSDDFLSTQQALKETIQNVVAT
ncbi:MAG: hypothetical protein KDD70_03530 [Bdellovibrionales bacterium]|nr:hypothetical protein [Bdellovibrionales bacterium]